MNRPAQLLRLLRPEQWLKNAFVFTGIIFSKSWTDLPLLLNVIVVAIAFCLVSSSVYIFNDLLDVEQDRQHPKKKFRPIASGEVSESVAAGLASMLAVLGSLLGMNVSLLVFAILLAYMILNFAYSIRLKQIVILDVFCIATGFMLRIMAGTKGVGIPPSKWLILCGLMVTLFMGFAKRRAELMALRGHREEHRKVLGNYSALLLDELIGITATGVIITYSLYTMSPDTVKIHSTNTLIYTVPFVIYALFRYIYLLHHQHAGEDPSNELLRDPHILSAVACWAILTTWIIINKGLLPNVT